MSWLARSIANSLSLSGPTPPADDAAASSSSNPSSIPESPRGVKEDFSDLKSTLSRQLRGVASFLAPPPSLPDDAEGGREDDVPAFDGIRSDFAEIEDRVRTGISRISSNVTVWEFTKMASALFQPGEEVKEEWLELEKEEEVGVIGVTEEAVAFARNISNHPETWLDFPIVEGDEEDDFELSDAQYDHALAIEKEAPGLAALRMELCPGYMTEGCFWKIYFVLLHPRLNKEDAVLLSTPQIMELRAMLTQELHRRNSGKPKSDQSKEGAVFDQSVPPSSGSVSEVVETSATGTANSNVNPVSEIEKHPVQISEVHVSEKPVDGEKQIDVDQVKYQLANSSSPIMEDKYEDDGDDWLKEDDTSEIAAVKGTTTINIENDEDVSFSDLEDDE
ncbi:hypothetical protein MLD38_009521 [Melastoma candidum]|uniref:Uncharacterized protein n=1 Tax=Melastoma candidum TaxID=119954 RepID=A0ACB9RX87_9MYRT|nr:hypothetical protein MLD38_009521 [Melastoma candidum]